MHGRARAGGDVGIPGRIDYALGEDGLAACLALGDHAANCAVLHDRRHTQAMQHRRDAGLLHQRVGNPLEHFGVERVAQRLRLRHGRAHGFGALLELDADAFAVDRLLMPVPGKALHANLRDIAAEAAVAVDEGGSGAGTGRGQRRGQAAGAAADHEDVGLQDHVDRAGGFVNLLHCDWWGCESTIEKGIRGRERTVKVHRQSCRRLLEWSHHC